MNQTVLAPSKTMRSALPLALACALISLFCFIAPMYVIRPFRPQGPTEFPFALAVRQAAPLVTAICVLFSIALASWAWRAGRTLSRIGLILCVLLSLAGAAAARVNIFEIMFHPYSSPAFGTAGAVTLDNDDMVMSVSLGGETHAYPVRTMGYHHIVNDVVGGVPVAATYCTLCHTGIVWKRVVDGRILTFRLTGIRNGNALLRDEETGSIWQQTTGIAVFGPLKGKHLQLLHSDELTFALWNSEQPHGLILKPNLEFASLYDGKDWEKSIEKTHVVVDTSKSGINPHELMLGIATKSASKAFPWQTVLSAKLIQDRVGADSVLLIVGPDNLSFRAFRIQSNASFLRTDTGGAGIMTDGETSSVWNFSGCAMSGPLSGTCLQPLDVKKGYWFDWLNYHPATTVFPSEPRLEGSAR